MINSIARSTWTYAGALILLGLVGYFATGAQSVTALIPAFFAIFVLVVMLVAKRFGSTSYLWSMVILGAIGFMATVSGVPKIFGLLTGQELARPAAVISQTIMALSSVIYVIVLFATARRKSGSRQKA